LRALAADRHVTADVPLRARIVLWAGEGRRRKDIAELAGVSARTVDRIRTRYAGHGVAGLVEKKRGGGKDQVTPQTRGRVIALTRMSPPPESGLSHWSTRTLAAYLKRTEGIKVARSRQPTAVLDGSTFASACVSPVRSAHRRSSTAPACPTSLFPSATTDSRRSHPVRSTTRKVPCSRSGYDQVASFLSTATQHIRALRCQMWSSIVLEETSQMITHSEVHVRRVLLPVSSG
jgi:transposase